MNDVEPPVTVKSTEPFGNPQVSIGLELSLMLCPGGVGDVDGGG